MIIFKDKKFISNYKNKKLFNIIQKLKIKQNLKTKTKLFLILFTIILTKSLSFYIFNFRYFFIDNRYFLILRNSELTLFQLIFEKYH